MTNKRFNQVPFEHYQMQVHKACGYHIMIREASYTNASAPVIADCTRHNTVVHCDYARDLSRVSQCYLCKEEERDFHYLKLLKKNFKRFLKEIQEHYRLQAYTYELAEASFLADRIPSTTGTRFGMFKLSDRVITVTCPLHGPFTRPPYKHMASKGCLGCEREFGLRNSRFKTLEDILDALEATNINGFDYTDIVLCAIHKKQKFTCKHGTRTSTIEQLLKGKGCRACANERRLAFKLGVPWMPYNKKPLIYSQSDLDKLNEMVAHTFGKEK